MAITTTITQACKKDLLDGIHDTADAYKCALAAAATRTYDKTKGYADLIAATSEEHAASGNYATGGAALTRVATVAGDTVNLDFDDAVWATATISAVGCVVYNSSDSNATLLWQDFGGTKSSSAAEFRVAIANLIALSGA